MRSLIVASVLLLGSGMMTPPAHAVGCLSGGAAGALTGHMAGHGVLGALGGCVAGHASKKHQLRQQDYQSYQNYDAGRRRYDPDYRSPYQ